MANFLINNASMIRIDDRLSLLSDTYYVQVGVPSAPIAPIQPTRYGTVLVGITGQGVRPIALIMRRLPLWDFGVFVNRDELFPQGVPEGFGGLQWEAWYVPFRTGYEIEVLGVQL